METAIRHTKTILSYACLATCVGIILWLIYAGIMVAGGN